MTARFPTTSQVLLLGTLSCILLLVIRQYVVRVSSRSGGHYRRLLDSFAHFDNPSLKWTPIDCEYLLELAKNRQVWDCNKDHLYARWTTTNPPFWISMNNWVYDKMRKVIYDEGEYYEHSLTTIFARILKFAPPNSRVIDVGGNIGWFTLLSAAHGHHVDVFEPNKVNIIRQCQSMWLNRWTTTTEDEVLTRTTKKGSIHILPYGVGSNTTSMTFFVGKNPGKATTLRDMLPRNKRPRSIEEIPIVTLDSMASDLGWFDQKMPVIILKVDVEGFEPSVFGGAKKLLKAHLIENILMEVTGQMDNTENRVMLQTILDAGYYLYQVGGPEGPSRGYDEFQGSNEDHSQALLDKFTKRHGLQANFWWKVKRDDVVKTER